MSDLYSKASLVMDPQLVDTGKVYSIKPENRRGDFTFTRSSAATRVNASGNIEKETQNLFTYSNTFSDSSWLKADTSVTGGQAGYDGTNDAWLLEITGSTGFQTIRKQPISFSGVNTFSFYAKAGTLSWLRVRANVENTYFDIGNGVVGSTDSSIGVSIEAVGNGYYRCVVPVEGSSSVFYIYPASGDGNVSQSSGNIYIQDAQWEQGLVARDYIETTTAAVEGGITDNVPRLDYTDSSCPALLLEPQRTNLFTNSEYTGGYGNFGSTDTPNNASSPEGVQNAVLVEGDGTQPQVFFNTPNVTLSSAGSYTISVFAKKGTSNYMQISLDGFTGAGNGSGYFDLENGTTTYSGASIEDYGNDWYRCILVVTIDAGDLFGRIAIRVTPSTSGFLWSSSSEANGKNIYMYGFQLEAGSYATSYIPTYGTSVTRNGDRYETKSLNNFVDTANGFSFYYEIRDFELTEVSFADYFSIRVSDAVSTNIRSEMRNNGTAGVFATGVTGFTTLNINDWYSAGDSIKKMCIVMTNNSQKVFVNGVLKASSTNTLTLPTFQQLNSDLNAGQTAQMKFAVNQTMLFQSALTDQEAIDLTTIV